MQSVNQTPSTFFILGRPRSGTTLLKTLFDAHPNVKIPPELPIFLPLFQKFKNIKQWDEAMILSFVDHVFADNTFNLRKIDNYFIDRQKFTDRLLQLQGKLTIQDLLFKVNEHSFSIFNKSEIYMVGDKNPVYSIFTRQLVKIFPKAKFICIVRDFRDTYISLKNLKAFSMEAPVLPLQVLRWKAITEVFLSCRKQYPDRFYLIRYEDLVTNPENEFRMICEFLEVPYVEQVFNFYQKKDEFIARVRDPRILEIHRSLLQPINTTRIGLWKGEMKPSEKSLASGIAGQTGKKLLYLTVDKKPGLTALFKTAPWYIYNTILFRSMITGSKMPYPLSRFVSLQVVRLSRI